MNTFTTTIHNIYNLIAFIAIVPGILSLILSIFIIWSYFCCPPEKKVRKKHDGLFFWKENNVKFVLFTNYLFSCISIVTSVITENKFFQSSALVYFMFLSSFYACIIWRQIKFCERTYLHHYFAGRTGNGKNGCANELFASLSKERGIEELEFFDPADPGAGIQKKHLN